MAHTTIPTRSSPTPDVTPGSTSPAVLPRRLGLWSAIAVVVGITIGSGIFRTPAGVTNRLPGPLPVFGVWIAGGIVAVSYTHLRAHETGRNLVCRLLLEKK